MRLFVFIHVQVQLKWKKPKSFQINLEILENKLNFLHKKFISFLFLSQSSKKLSVDEYLIVCVSVWILCFMLTWFRTSLCVIELNHTIRLTQKKFTNFNWIFTVVSSRYMYRKQENVEFYLKFKTDFEFLFQQYVHFCLYSISNFHASSHRTRYLKKTIWSDFVKVSNLILWRK